MNDFQDSISPCGEICKIKRKKTDDNKDSNECDLLENIFQKIKLNHSLTKLKLCFANIGPSTCVLINKFLMEPNQIKSMDLSNNPLGDEGVETIVNALNQKYTTLVNLDLQKVCIGTRGGRAIFNILKENDMLCVDVQNNKIRTYGGTIGKLSHFNRSKDFWVMDLKKKFIRKHESAKPIVVECGFDYVRCFMGDWEAEIKTVVKFASADLLEDDHWKHKMLVDFIFETYECYRGVSGVIHSEWWPYKIGFDSFWYNIDKTSRKTPSFFVKKGYIITKNERVFCNSSMSNNKSKHIE